jgi:uncharacterized protein (UPF0264 family)
MTKLLISVRSAEEAQIALEEGADLIDVKEPSRGSLGAADIATIAEIVERVAGRVPLSAALGELLDAARLPGALAGQLRYAKFGLAGCAMQPGWVRRWEQAIDALERRTMPAAVAYVDWKTALAPDPWDVLTHAIRLGCGAILLDTCDKSLGSLRDHVVLSELGRLIDAAQQGGLKCALAGSLGWDEINGLLPLAPDYVAVRGCVCVGDRTSRLDRQRVRRLVALVRKTNEQASAVELA